MYLRVVSESLPSEKTQLRTPYKSYSGFHVLGGFCSGSASDLFGFRLNMRPICSEFVLHDSMSMTLIIGIDLE
jgi:hypothetical protein